MENQENFVELKKIETTSGLFSFGLGEERKYFLEQIKLIDGVMLGDKKDVYKRIKQIKPDVIVLGYDQNYFTEKLSEKIQELGLK